MIALNIINRWLTTMIPATRGITTKPRPGLAWFCCRGIDYTV